MNHCEDGASPEDAIVAFKVYCEDLAKLDVLNTGLFFDLYHPMAQLRGTDSISELCPRLECQQVPQSLLASQTSWYAWCQRSHGSHMSRGGPFEISGVCFRCQRGCFDDQWGSSGCEHMGSSSNKLLSCCFLVFSRGDVMALK